MKLKKLIFLKMEPLRTRGTSRKYSNCLNHPEIIRKLTK